MIITMGKTIATLAHGPSASRVLHLLLWSPCFSPGCPTPAWTLHQPFDTLREPQYCRICWDHIGGPVAATKISDLFFRRKRAVIVS